MKQLPPAHKHCSKSITTFLHGIILISREFHFILFNIALNLTQPFHLPIKQMNPNYVTIVKQDLNKFLNMWVSLP
jgi:hypothetical protein